MPALSEPRGGAAGWRCPGSGFWCADAIPVETAPAAMSEAAAMAMPVLLRTVVPPVRRRFVAPDTSVAQHGDHAAVEA
ncbi:hypothetical protein Aph02nite_44000 [Actinoplanes philippinensis]|nr:hypothetical protein Aph02nite_44000 [Actinoplanes philippinensis]